MKKQWRITDRNRVFFLIWLGQLASLIGSGFTMFALAVWVYQGTNSVSKFALVAFFGAVPGVLLAPIAGALVDRWDRRWVMVLSDLGSGFSTLFMWLLLRAGTLELWQIYLAVAFSAACEAFQWPAYNASVTLLVPKEKAGRSGGMLQLGPAIAQVITPLMAGFLMASIGLQGIITIDLATLVVALFLMFIVVVPRPEASDAGKAGKGSLWKEAGFGWAYVRQRPGLLGLLAFFAMFNLVMGLVVVLITPLILSFAGTPVLGIVSSVSGLGMLLGGIIMSAWGGPKRRIHGVIGFSIPCGAILFLGGVRPNAVLIAVAAFIYLFCVQVISGSSHAIWQVKIAADIQGRVFAVRLMVRSLMIPLTRLLAGPLSDYVFEPLLAPGGALAGSVGRVIGVGPGRGVGFLFIVLGALTLLTAVVAYASPRLHRIEDELPDVVTNKETDMAKKTQKDPRKARRRWAVAGGVLLALIVIIAGVGTWFVRRPWPQVEGTIKVDGLTAPVKVLRDAYGIPQIYAENEHDLFFAQGYVHAQDRLWQMETMRRLGNGTMSAAVGKRSVSKDLYYRALGLRRVAEESWEKMDAETRTILENYSAGVNAYANTHRDRLPIEFTLFGVDYEPWTPVDTLTYGNLLSRLLSGNLSFELIRLMMTSELGEDVVSELFPSFDPEMPLIIPEGVDLYKDFQGMRFDIWDMIEAQSGYPSGDWGSNDWAVHGDRTASGMPILANDTHLGTLLPSYWYANGLHGGRFDCVGFTFAGVPLIIIGHNASISWGTTNLGPDTQDIYWEKLDDRENPTQYEYMGEWRDLRVVEETIEVKNGKPQTFKVYFTNHGPIINEFSTSMSGGEPISLRWTLFEGNLLMQSVVHLNLATNWEEFRDALRDWDLPGQNFVYADVNGNIGYQATGRTPIRVKDHQGMLPVTGWTGAYEWQGYIPFDEMPAVLNPPDGYVATANNKITPDDYPYVMTYDWFPGYRAKLITDLLAASTQHTVETIEKIQADTYSLPAEYIRPYMLAIEPETDQQAKAIELLKDWDLRLETDRVGATIYEAWYVFTLRNTIEDNMSDNVETQYLSGNYQRHGTQHVPLMRRLLADPENAWFDDVSTPDKVETRDDILRRGLVDALEWLGDQYGKDPNNWTWGRAHVVSFSHLTFGSIPVLGGIFNSRTIPARGDAFTIDAMGFAWNLPFEVGHGVAHRMIVDMADFDKMEVILTTGQSEHLFNPHREDMLQMWQDVKYIQMPSSQEAVEANTESTLILQP
ncbi:MAG: MFS transporter [Anaerolineae bacterium]|nr:MFS transporter [Anaerolineae bacterium]